MSINKLISIENPIIDAMDMLQLDHHQDKPVFIRWATLAEKQINSYQQYVKKRAVLDIVNCSAKLPVDARFVQRAILGDLGCDCEDLFNTVCTQIPLSSATINASTTTNTFLIVDMGTGFTEILGSIPHVIQDNKIILNHNYDGQKITIQYLGYQTDANGFWMVGENHVEAITYNLCWKYYMRKRNINSLEYGKMKEYKELWHQHCSDARAKDGELTESERTEIAYMLSDPWIGMGMEVNNTSLMNFMY